MGSFGEELRREREVRGITLAEIASATTIEPRLLEALEDNDFSVLPQDVYTRGFIRAYARHLGIDEEKLSNQYLYESGQVRPARTHTEGHAAGKDLPAILSRWGGYALAFALVVFVLWLLLGNQPH